MPSTWKFSIRQFPVGERENLGESYLCQCTRTPEAHLPSDNNNSPFPGDFQLRTLLGAPFHLQQPPIERVFRTQVRKLLARGGGGSEPSIQGNSTFREIRKHQSCELFAGTPSWRSRSWNWSPRIRSIGLTRDFRNEPMISPTMSHLITGCSG